MTKNTTTMGKNVLSIRIDKELLDNIVKLTKFFNQELLSNKISGTAFMENLFIKGLKYYYKTAYDKCKNDERKIEKLDDIKMEFDDYLHRPIWQEGVKVNKTISIDENLHARLKTYVDFENSIWKRDWKVNGLLVGCLVNGLAFYLEADKKYIKTMHVDCDFYDPNELIQEIELEIRKFYLKMHYK